MLRWLDGKSYVHLGVTKLFQLLLWPNKSAPYTHVVWCFKQTGPLLCVYVVSCLVRSFCQKKFKQTLIFFFFYIHGTRWLMRCQYNLSISQLRSTNKASLNVDSLQRWNSNFKKIIIWHGRYNISTTPQMKCTWFPKEQGYTKDIIYRKAYMNLPKINLNIFFLHS